MAAERRAARAGWACHRADTQRERSGKALPSRKNLLRFSLFGYLRLIAYGTPSQTATPPSRKAAQPRQAALRRLGRWARHTLGGHIRQARSTGKACKQGAGRPCQAEAGGW